MFFPRAHLDTFPSSSLRVELPRLADPSKVVTTPRLCSRPRAPPEHTARSANRVRNTSLIPRTLRTTTFEEAAAAGGGRRAEGESVRMPWRGTPADWGAPSAEPNVELHTTGSTRSSAQRRRPRALSSRPRAARPARRRSRARASVSLDPPAGAQSDARRQRSIQYVATGRLPGTSPTGTAPRATSSIRMTSLSDGTIVALRAARSYDCLDIATVAKLFGEHFGHSDTILAFSVTPAPARAHSSTTLARARIPMCWRRPRAGC